MREFFGLTKVNGGYEFTRLPEGAWSWQHLTLVSILMALMVGLAIFFGKRNKDKPIDVKNHVLADCVIR